MLPLPWYILHDIWRRYNITKIIRLGDKGVVKCLDNRNKDNINTNKYKEKEKLMMMIDENFGGSFIT